MAFDEYQFLRYFIPGSLYVIYVVALLSPFFGNKVFELLITQADSDAILGLIGGAFGVSLAFGYVIYTFYDTAGYNKIAMDPKNRPILRYLESHINYSKEWKKLNNFEKKVALDVLCDSFDDTEVSNRIAGKIRGIWSHFNARIVCGSYVPIFAGLTSAFIAVFIILLIGNQTFILNDSTWTLFLLIVCSIATISYVTFKGANRPLREATKIEFLYLKPLLDKEPPTKTEKETIYFKKIIDSLIENPDK